MHHCVSFALNLQMVIEAAQASAGLSACADWLQFVYAVSRSLGQYVSGGVCLNCNSDLDNGMYGGAA
ncbi:hypothetical protein Patl1_04517 [Pistacia atlantica]|uniref:Uncharacterized protein n=1 Tax=Pistacia atlantica TaxID=434234 RepID=A0ACC1BRA6_9ROSI|nr:hypothetical protein Patl1_04517 [Pistacia atlantica]